MADAITLPTTQRAYTLRLRGINESDRSWRDALWATHEAVNKGAKVFGDWLLTLRGGLDHRLADQPPIGEAELGTTRKALESVVKGQKDEHEEARTPTDDEVRQKAEDDRRARIHDRRILLALSWLSVEDAHGAPQDESLLVARGTDSADCRARKLCDALTDILKTRGVPDSESGDPNKRPEDQPGTWLGDCMPSLSAAIREDAVWVNRNALFDNFTLRTGALADRDYAAFTVLRFLELKGPYFALPNLEGDDTDTVSMPTEDKPLVNEATGWLCENWGAGLKSDKAAISGKLAAFANSDLMSFVGKSGAMLLQELCRLTGVHVASSKDHSTLVKGLCRSVGWKGRKSAGRMAIESAALLQVVTDEDLKTLSTKLRTESEGKLADSKVMVPEWMRTERMHLESLIGMPYRGEKDHTFEFAVLLDHALRKVSSAHSWIQNAEAERQRFEKDAKRLGNVSQQAQDWLRKYGEERAGPSGSLDAYRIRRRAIDGWDKIVQAWAALGPNSTRPQRIEAARKVQANLDDNEKFGDIQLFAGFGDEDEDEPEACLADDAALCVWKPAGKPTPQPLKDFVAATDAEAKQKRFKVPAYRHPDPLRHPVFCDFGKSRWSITFEIHRAWQHLQRLRPNVQEAETKLSEARTEKERCKALEKLNKSKLALAEAEKEWRRLRRKSAIRMKLWNGTTLEDADFNWQSKRLSQDLGLRGEAATEATPLVTRADRMGRAVAGVQPTSPVTVRGLFDLNEWNGRLQAPRALLDAIARHVDKNGWDAKAREMIDRIRWLVSFSAQLECSGPWHTYFNDQADKSPFQKLVASGPRKGQRYESANGWPHTISNDTRQGHARLLLSRLPGLRVLSVDLGHRYAAACAVWEAISGESLTKEIEGCQIAAGGSGPDDLYCHTHHTQLRGKERTTVYRRIGPDTLPDGSVHPAPWARLDRQFLIKLQGEDRPARKASPDEIEAVEQFEDWVGRNGSDDNPPRELTVDGLMSGTVRTVRLALKRHGDRARIAFAMTAEYKPMPGERKYCFNKPEDASRNEDEQKRHAKYVEFLQDALAHWHGLFSSRRWKDDAAKALWDQHIVALHGYQAPDEIAEDVSPAERKKRRQANKDKLRAAAESLAGNLQVRQQLHEEWKNRWISDDGAPAEVNRKTGRKLKDGTGWHARMRRLQDWLMPRRLSRVVEVVKKDGRRVKRRKPIREAIASASNVGGLSLTRIATLTEFRRKVQVGYFTRLKPDGSRAEIGLGFGESTLDTLERMKDQRIKQLASRIVEAALGVGIERHGENGRDVPRPGVRRDDPRFAPCHAVVIEDLSHYRPEETRTRRENRATMDWKSAETRKRLDDHCQLYGLHLRDVNPQYTSRQDSRTGDPGVRCVDVPVFDFLTKPWWRKQVARAQSKKDTMDQGDARDRYLLALEARWSAASEEEKARAAPLRITLNGGEIFVSAHPRSPLACGIQADLNAAANIGLRALMDPDFPGRWWYVPCDPATHQPKADKVKGCILENVGPLTEVKQADQSSPPKPKRKRSAKATKEKEVVNLWRDPAPELLNPKCWCEYSKYVSMVQFRVVQLLRVRAGLPRDESH